VPSANLGEQTNWGAGHSKNNPVHRLRGGGGEKCWGGGGGRQRQQTVFRYRLETASRKKGRVFTNRVPSLARDSVSNKGTSTLIFGWGAQRRPPGAWHGSRGQKPKPPANQTRRGLGPENGFLRLPRPPANRERGAPKTTSSISLGGKGGGGLTPKQIPAAGLQRGNIHQPRGGRKRTKGLGGQRVFRN